MSMIGNRLDVAVDVWVEMLPALAVINAAGDHVEEMRDHARGDEQLSFRVVINAPWITESVRDNLDDGLSRGVTPPTPDTLEAVLRRVITPPTAVDLDRVTGEHLLGKRIVAVIETPSSDRL